MWALASLPTSPQAEYLVIFPLSFLTHKVGIAVPVVLVYFEELKNVTPEPPALHGTQQPPHINNKDNLVSHVMPELPSSLSKQHKPFTFFHSHIRK